MAHIAKIQARVFQKLQQRIHSQADFTKDRQYILKQIAEGERVSLPGSHDSSLTRLRSAQDRLTRLVFTEYPRKNPRADASRILTSIPSVIEPTSTSFWSSMVGIVEACAKLHLPATDPALVPLLRTALAHTYLWTPPIAARVVMAVAALPKASHITDLWSKAIPQLAPEMRPLELLAILEAATNADYPLSPELSESFSKSARVNLFASEAYIDDALRVFSILKKPVGKSPRTNAFVLRSSSSITSIDAAVKVLDPHVAHKLLNNILDQSLLTGVDSAMSAAKCLVSLAEQTEFQSLPSPRMVRRLWTRAVSYVDSPEFELETGLAALGALGTLSRRQQKRDYLVEHELCLIPPLGEGDSTILQLLEPGSKDNNGLMEAALPLFLRSQASFGKPGCFEIVSLILQALEAHWEGGLTNPETRLEKSFIPGCDMSLKHLCLVVSSTSIEDLRQLSDGSLIRTLHSLFALRLINDVIGSDAATLLVEELVERGGIPIENKELLQQATEVVRHVLSPTEAISPRLIQASRKLTE